MVVHTGWIIGEDEQLGEQPRASTEIRPVVLFT